VGAFRDYTNVLGFFAGTEVADATNNTASMAYIKAAVRDVKACIKKKNYRATPVGYAMNEDGAIMTTLTNYLQCGDAASAADCQGLNMLFAECGPNTLSVSGCSAKIKEFISFTRPVFLSEYGCNVQSPRNFSEVSAIYGSAMTGVFSGCIVYQ
jgi:hypothetical protein